MKAIWNNISWFGAVLALIIQAFPGQAKAQESIAWYDYVRSELKWYTIETEHFQVHFHSDESGEGSRTARVVSQIAEDMYGPMTDLYDYRPDTKVSFVLKDYEDYSNGAAYFFDNVIEIWAPALNTPFRGDHNWLRNVISHEFTHMIQVQKTMKTSRKLPFFYLQYLSYEKVTRPDVLYGFPNVLASYPVPILNNPAWLAEGTAQYQREWSDYDRWDAHRDMLLRTQVLAGEELTLDEMGGFYSHTSLMRESVYNHGFAFTQYLAHRFGEDGLRKLSEALSQWTNINFEQAAKDAFGIRGEELYENWMSDLRAYYTEQSRPDATSPHLIEESGFNNFYARLSPDGTKIAYLSNKGQDFSKTGIWIRELDGTANWLAVSSEEMGHSEGYTCAWGHKIVPAASGPIDWLPDGRVVYSKTRDTENGNLYLDIYAYDLEKKESEPLTHDLRAFSPSVAPNGQSIVVVVQGDGTTNLHVLDRTTGGIDPLTHFEDGSQVTEPVFDPSGEWIYFGYGKGHGRDIKRIRVSDGHMESVLDGPEDERSPAFDQQGRLVYSSDKLAIFDLYRLEKDGSSSILTRESGGAFMPWVGSNGVIYYSSYVASGYKIAQLEPPSESFGAQLYMPPPFLTKSKPLNGLDDSTVAFNGRTDESTRAFTPAEMDSVSSYKPTFTSLNFLPVLRLDGYVSRKRSRTDVRLKDRTRSETLRRNTKVGVYTGTREAIGGLSFFGGVLVGPGSGTSKTLGDFVSPSNLLDLERDVIVQVEYSRGLPFIHKRWNPHFSLALFNIRRNVENGLAIEEFPCTSCYPDSTLTDLAYDLWEVDFQAKSKISRYLMATAGYRYSPYRVTTKRFYSKELKLFIPSSASRYYIGRAFHSSVIFEAFDSYRDMNVVPHGVRAELSFERETGQLLKSFSIRDGILTPEYDDAVINRLTFEAKGGMRLKNWPGEGAHGLGGRVRISAILGKELDDFYNDYVGGLTGARGYPFYALGGNKSAWGQLSYSFPVFPRISKQIGFIYLDKVYAKVYVDAANAWSGSFDGLSSFKKDIGLEARFGIGSFYLLPTAFFVSGTYGLDSFNFQLDEGFVTPSGSSSVRYGESMQWHAGLLFGFDQL